MKAGTVRGGITLVIIDGQIDFHHNGGKEEDKGSLAVDGSDEDAERIAALIRSSIRNPNGPKISRIVATMDSHHRLDICHSQFWVSEDGEHPNPFTMISSKDIEDGTWIPRTDIKFTERLVDPNIFKTNTNIFDEDGDLDLKAYCIEYTKSLEQSGRFKHIIWPDHCLIGTRGHCMEKNIYDAMMEWSAATGSMIEYVHKGDNPLSEMYSALKAEVEICPKTKLNHDLLMSLKQSEHILICGQALSHCVNNTTRDLIDNMKGEEHKIVLLQDCTSAVTDIEAEKPFEKASEGLKKYIQQKGGTLCKSTSVFDEIPNTIPSYQDCCVVF